MELIAALSCRVQLPGSRERDRFAYVALGSAGSNVAGDLNRNGDDVIS